MSCFSNLTAKLQSLKASNQKKYSCLGESTSNPEKLTAQEKSKFVNLAPTNKADDKGTYYRALSFATNDPDIQNIALTGPYGSGKSSVIQTFLTKYKGTALQVSLAAFVPEKNSIDENGVPDTSETPTKVDKKDIERSILQQMLYGADANKLPLSRFNRIQSPTECSRLISLLSLLGAFSTVYLLSKIAKLFNGELLAPFEISNWFNYVMLFISGLFLWFLAHKIYLQTFGISLKSVSLKNIELASTEENETSILNKHLDEIIYFFQSTKYDLVIFEDLDRFKDPSIFVTLREINNLVNANAGIKRRIRFLYALRDDIFKNTERTKFFEFIVPVIPIINHSNSIDKVLELVEKQGLTGKLNSRFLGEVSRYLTDMRLIRSIFNEYEIYSTSLEDDDGNVHDPDKLLAILIYKNVFPYDFEKLHQQDGVLAKILGEYDKYVSKTESDCKAKIRILENEIIAINEELPKDIGELNRIYAMALIELFPQGYNFIVHKNQTIFLKDFIAYEGFEELILSNKVNAGHQQGYSPKSIDISNLQASIDSQNTYSERKAKIEQKTATEQAQINTKIRKLKLKAASVKTQKFHKILQANEDQVTTILSKPGENTELLQYLVFEGYLDDTYYLYISLFHAGRMSPNDDKFIKNIRGFKPPNPSFKIDNPDEVIKEMRDEDFSRDYVLNHILMDFLVENSTSNALKLKSALKYISENFDECEDFFSGYYTSGKNVDEFVYSLANQWPSFAVEALEGNSGANHIAKILAYVPQKTIVDSLNKNQVITEFLSVSGQQVFDHKLSLNPDKLAALKVKIVDLSSMAMHLKLLDYVMTESLYVISPDNINFVLSENASPPKSQQITTSNLTTILESGYDPLISYVKENYDAYFEEVFFAIKSNTEESLETMHHVLSDEGILSETKERILASQNTVFPSFEEVPIEFHSNLLEHKTIEPSWENLVFYRNSKAYDESVLTQYLQDLEVVERLKPSRVPAEEEATDLRWFIFNNDEFEDEQYQTYIQLLPKHFKDFPKSASYEKLQILINANKIRLNENSFTFLDDERDLQTAFLISHIDEYLANKEAYLVDDDMRGRLISSSIAHEHKYRILVDLDVESVVGNSDLARNIANVLVATDFNPEEFDFEYLKSVIVNATKVKDQIKLLNDCRAYWAKEQIYSIIKCLPEPFSKIAEPRRSPKIPKTSENLIFTEWLNRKGFISSHSVKENKIHINNYKNAQDFNH